jgi:muconolactone D-isomerase
MEFLVHIEIAMPPQMSNDEREGLNRAERERAAELARAGTICRLWRIPGRTANWGLWEAPDATALHDALRSLPLFGWMDVAVHPLADHPSDPQMTRLLSNP